MTTNGSTCPDMSLSVHNLYVFHGVHGPVGIPDLIAPLPSSPAPTAVSYGLSASNPKVQEELHEKYPSIPARHDNCFWEWPTLFRKQIEERSSGRSMVMRRFRAQHSPAGDPVWKGKLEIHCITEVYLRG